MRLRRAKRVAKRVLLTALEAVSKMAAEILGIYASALHIDAPKMRPRRSSPPSCLIWIILLRLNLNLGTRFGLFIVKRYTRVPRRTNVVKAMSGIRFARKALDGHVWQDPPISVV